MKFTDGFWRLRRGVTALYAQEAYRIEKSERSVEILAPTKVIRGRGDTLNRPALTVTLSSPAEGVIRVRIDHFRGGRDLTRFVGAATYDGSQVRESGDEVSLRTGSLTARIRHGAPWRLGFELDGVELVASGPKSAAYVTLSQDAEVPRAPGDSSTYVLEQLSLGVGELIYGLGERFGPVVKNGQSVDIWNADGGTSSEHAYKNVPLYISNRGYGVFVNDPGPVSFEIGSEAVERVQFSVPGESLEYFVIAGPHPADVIDRYTRLVGRPSPVPAWSYGLWLSTSFLTEYDEKTVTTFVEEMSQRDIPLSVFHIDCFWMRGFSWSDFTWDREVFPDPEGTLSRLHDRDLRVCVWINPYIAQQSGLFEEAKNLGYLLKRPNGEVWQWDVWQAGMALVDFTNPDAKEWFKDKLRALLRQGVDAFKTDFGERIPLDVSYFDGSDPTRTHNLYALLYNQAVFEVLQEEQGAGNALVFARSGTAGSQTLPVHWSGDPTPSFESMAGTLRGGLSLSWSGFAFWSHDIGGFEGTPDAAVFKRWLAFGLLSSHSRLHGSESYRVPWAYDEEAVDVTRRFVKLKLRLMPYLYALGVQATRSGAPLMRAMAFEFPDDPATSYLDRQYMLGPDVLVAPVMSRSGRVEFYLPSGEWRHLLTGETKHGGWHSETYGFDSLPLFARPSAAIPLGNRDDRPEYGYLDGVTIAVGSGYPLSAREVEVVSLSGSSARFLVEWADDHVIVSGPPGAWSAQLVGGEETPNAGGRARLPLRSR